MFLRRITSTPYLITINIIIFNSNVSFVMSQGLSRYDRKGKILLIDSIRKICYPLYEKKIRQINELTRKSLSQKNHVDVDLGQLEVLKTLKSIKTSDEGCAIKCTAACENLAGKL